MDLDLSDSGFAHHPLETPHVQWVTILEYMFPYPFRLHECKCQCILNRYHVKYLLLSSWHLEHFDFEQCVLCPAHIFFYDEI